MKIEVNSIENKVGLLKQSAYINDKGGEIVENSPQLSAIWAHPSVITVNTLYNEEIVADRIVNELFSKYNLDIKVTTDLALGPHPFYIFIIDDTELPIRIPKIKGDLMVELQDELFKMCMDQINEILNQKPEEV